MKQLISRVFFLGCVSILPRVALLEVALAEEESTRPNILLILCDDLGYADVGFNAQHFGVETDVVTPNIDSLARRGTIFTQAYVPHPFCGPSRMGLMAGRMPHCFGGQKNLPDVAKNLEDYNQRGIPESETLISTVLKQSGYRTGCIGKWHMGDAEPFHPNTRGFDEFYGFLGGGHLYYPSDSDKVEPKKNDYQFLLQRNGKSIRSPEGAYLTDTLSDEAISFIRTSASDPFFLYLAYNAPHSPLQGKTEDLKYLYPDHPPANPGNGINFQDYEKRQNYVAMMYAVDRGIGKITQTLVDPNQDGDDSDSILDKTLIVFLSDNGGKILQAGNNAPLQDDKGSTHEGGIRVPMFMHWPGKIAAGSVFEHSVHALDFYPTFSKLAGASIPSNKLLDGEDVWSNIRDNTPPHVDDTLHWLRHHGAGNEVAIRRNDLKACRKMGGKWQVFDVARDPGETKDLSRDQAKLLGELIETGADWSRGLIDPQWHDTAASLHSWIKNEMPQYDSTYRRRP